jgi:hypothetical protein
MIDASTSVGSAQFRKACKERSVVAREAIEKLSQTVHSRSQISAFFSTSTGRAIDIKCEDACSSGRDRFTYLANALPKEPPPSGAVVMLTDGVEHHWPLPAVSKRNQRRICENFRDNALRDIQRWKIEHPDTSLTLLLAEPASHEQCKDTAIQPASCPQGVTCYSVEADELTTVKKWQSLRAISSMCDSNGRRRSSRASYSWVTERSAWDWWCRHLPCLQRNTVCQPHAFDSSIRRRWKCP